MANLPLQCRVKMDILERQVTDILVQSPRLTARPLVLMDTCGRQHRHDGGPGKMRMTRWKKSLWSPMRRQRHGQDDDFLRRGQKLRIIQNWLELRGEKRQAADPAPALLLRVIVPAPGPGPWWGPR